MSKKAPLKVIEDAIAKADTSYFFENYTKQAQAVLAALKSAGYAITATDYPEDVWKQVADQMKTGRVKPEQHVKNVVETFFRIAGESKY